MYLYAGLLLVFIFSGFMYNRFRVTRKQNKLIALQKKDVELKSMLVEKANSELSIKNKEITDSIIYAKRIQAAILPPRNKIETYLGQSFVIYQPKDIVAGDFYWLEIKDDKVIFAVADCTGHGVPGAMVSVVCNNGLNRSVREYGLTRPNEILDKTRDIVIQEFDKSEEDVNDGMDISLVSLDFNSKILQWSGANNALIIVRGSEVIEIKADKQPIGKYVKAKPFTNHELELVKGDVIYAFTDGFHDQFGGPNGKKYLYKRFRELLLKNASLDMKTQQTNFVNVFNEWKGENEQVDDICIIGVRI
jgi:serine phosphatase RsbU (regulator of sigma subunit)